MRPDRRLFLAAGSRDSQEVLSVRISDFFSAYYLWKLNISATFVHN